MPGVCRCNRCSIHVRERRSASAPARHPVPGRWPAPPSAFARRWKGARALHIRRSPTLIVDAVLAARAVAGRTTRRVGFGGATANEILGAAADAIVDGSAIGVALFCRARELAEAPHTFLRRGRGTAALGIVRAVRLRPCIDDARALIAKLTGPAFGPARARFSARAGHASRRVSAALGVGGAGRSCRWNADALFTLGAIAARSGLAAREAPTISAYFALPALARERAGVGGRRA